MSDKPNHFAEGGAAYQAWYEKGFQAHATWENYPNNPHPEDSVANREWDIGFEDAYQYMHSTD